MGLLLHLIVLYKGSIDMATIKPFKALKPADGLADKIAALPYDVYSREEAAKKVENDNYSFLRIDRPETQFPADQDMYAPEVYKKASQMLSEMERDGSFVQESKGCYYLYELTMAGRAQTGLVAVSSVDDYINGVIKKHENTRKEKEADRIRHVDTCNAQTGPIFLSYRPVSTLKKIIDEQKKRSCDVDFVADDGIRHRVWTIADDEIIDLITKEFEKITATYIADGHHRAASAVNASLKRRAENPNYSGKEEFNYFLSVIFSSDELKIMDYNRLIFDMKGNDEDSLLKKLEEKFEVEKKGAQIYHPQKKGEIGLYLNECWYKLICRPEYIINDPVEGLDVAYLQREILAPVFGIEDPSTDDRIGFVGGIRGLEELEKRCHLDAKCAFAMYPTDINELFATADAGKLMPPKSTWFEPKLRSGLFTHKI